MNPSANEGGTSSAPHRTHARTTSIDMKNILNGEKPNARKRESVSSMRAYLDDISSDGDQERKQERDQDRDREVAAASISMPIPNIQKPAPVTWMSLPKKGQLILLGLSRVFDFLQVASLQAFMFYQLKSFDPGLSDSMVSSQAGLLQGAFTAAQFATAIPWGRVADASWGGRKRVLLIGLVGTSISCIGLGFSTTFAQAIFWRVLGGAINGTVGIIRTMIAENVKEKKFQSRAFLILPLSFNIANFFGPVMGGLLADPVQTYPKIFGAGGSYGGQSGVQWMMAFPYALPSLLNTLFLGCTAVCVFLGLEETLEIRKHKFDAGLYVKSRLKRFVMSVWMFVTRKSSSYRKLSLQDEDDYSYPPSNASNSVESLELLEKEKKPPKRHHHSGKLSFRRIWIPNVIFTLIAEAFFDFHMGAFQNLWLLFLSTPRYDSTNPTFANLTRHLPFLFTGGLGMPPKSVGLATAVLGLIGMTLQLSVYPVIQGRLGTVKSYQWSLMIFPFAYFIAPYLALVHSSSPPPAEATGFWIWFFIVVVLFLHVAARTFALPASIILLNNCSPHPSVLGTIHGIGQSVTSLFRTLGPIIGGIWYGQGLENGVVGTAWWACSAVATVGCGTAMLVYEGSGHEIILDGEEEEEEEDM
ncbi:MAG: hypothetical protein M1834_003086 [Cirrosporium novae-zelandiae]|nr:MAG: hypothetical protein M1834_003086 [Cirrosporium novae-zelandiae]